MARSARKPKEPTSEEIKTKDFATAVRIFRGDIKPAAGKVGEHAQEMSTAYKEIKKLCHIQPQAARLAFRLDDMEESKRDDFLRSFNGLLAELNIHAPSDMVDAMEQPAPRPKPTLVTIPSGPDGDADLAGDD